MFTTQYCSRIEDGGHRRRSKRRLDSAQVLGKRQDTCGAQRQLLGQLDRIVSLKIEKRLLDQRVPRPISIGKRCKSFHGFNFCQHCQVGEQSCDSCSLWHFQRKDRGLARTKTSLLFLKLCTNGFAHLNEFVEQVKSHGAKRNVGLIGQVDCSTLSIEDTHASDIVIITLSCPLTKRGLS